jgi:hypothetical protein
MGGCPECNLIAKVRRQMVIGITAEKYLTRQQAIRDCIDALSTRDCFCSHSAVAILRGLLGEVER